MTDKKAVAITLVFLTIWIVIAQFCAVPLLQRGTEHDIVFRQVTTIENRGPQGFPLTTDDKMLPLLLNSTLYGLTQISHLRTSSHQIIERTVDPDGNPTAILDLGDEIEAGTTLVYSTTYEVKVKRYYSSTPKIEKSGKLKDIPQDLREKYCTEVGAWCTSNTNLRDAAETFVSDYWRGEDSNVLQLVYTVANSVKYRIRYSDTAPLYPNETLNVGYGVCRERTAVIVTLLRILGVPAYFQMGFIYHDGSMETESSYEGHVTVRLNNIAGWHAWALAYVPPWGWIPIDTADDDAVSDALVLKLVTVQYANILVTDYVNSFRQTLEEFRSGDRKDVYMEISQSVEKIVTNDYWAQGWVLTVGSAITTLVAWTYVMFRVGRARTQRVGQ